jgi:hypothetical protein
MYSATASAAQCARSRRSSRRLRKTPRGRTAYRVPHDFRRTAIRNLELAGVARSDAMAMVGHKTEAIYRRYAIADAKSMRAAAEKLGRLHQQQAQAPRKVVSMERKG